MPRIMGYYYPNQQEQFYSIHHTNPMGYICPMEMTFREALSHARTVTGRGKSLREIATSAGVSYDILKNINQGKSEMPNAEFAAKVAEFFGASLKDFLAGRVRKLSEEEAAEIAEDVAKVSDIMRNLEKAHRDQVRAFSLALFQTEEAEKQKK
ncbi:helix-turn-helix transcriptional regulator [Paracoccus sp. DMF-8]|uniref:helix-turn-helix domain-containing protein n=1 Tax=Paracoccus sp. DMF-8 TaxID=3019445 RepID=UPI0023E40D3B|nr:helix-turn-helix transcriptional regulator [Paracoccus sp. DMF-8]MDF3607526.1 helix-turn-helix transcriptional regulator [Paracoccus sp. DMF-8]